MKIGTVIFAGPFLHKKKLSLLNREIDSTHRTCLNVLSEVFVWISHHRQISIEETHICLDTNVFCVYRNICSQQKLTSTSTSKEIVLDKKKTKI